MKNSMFPARRPVVLRRSWLFVPGLNASAQAQGLASGADVLVADLEEFTASADRPAARERIAALMAECRAQGTVGAVRINRLEADGLDDLRGVMVGAPEVVLLPHVDSPQQIQALDRAITACEQAMGLPRGHVEVVPTLESALGLVKAQAILNASPRVVACLLAAEDLSADLGSERGPDGLELQHVRARFHVDCTAAACLAIDCPFSYRDPAALQADLRWARRIGLKAKCTVFPEQVDFIHQLLSPQLEDIERAKAIVARFEAEHQGQGSGTPPIDPPDYNTARRWLARAADFAAWTTNSRPDEHPETGD